MVLSERLQAGERELRRAVARRQYAGMLRELTDLRRMVEEDIADLPACERRELVAWMLATVRWARLMVVTERQSCAGELERLPKVGRYLDDSGKRARTMSIDL